MPAKEFSITLKPRTDIKKFVYSLDQNLISKGSLNNVTKGDVVHISRFGAHFYNGKKLVINATFNRIKDKAPRPPYNKDFLTFDPYPLGYWKSPSMTVKNSRLNFVKVVPTFNEYQSIWENFNEYSIKHKNKIFKVLVHYSIVPELPLIIIEKSDRPGYDFESMMWSSGTD